MAVIIASPLQVNEQDLGPSEEIVQLQILVKQEDWKGLFDQIEVWRSRSSINGPYEEFTNSRWAAARIPKLAKDEPATPVTGRSVVIVGLTLQLRVNEQDDLVITFTGADPLTYSDAASQITAQGKTKVRSYVDEDGLLVIETTEPGTGAVLRIVGGEAAPLLGLSIDEPDSLAFGRDARISLRDGVESYLFTDVRGSDAYFYKTRFRNKTTQGVSELSQPFSSGQALGLTSASIACGTLCLVGLDGKPLNNIEVSVYNAFRGDLVEGKLVSESSQRKITDSNGRVEFFLVRGTKLTVAISGTSIVRDIVVPTDPSVLIFPLLGADPGTGDDHWKVQVPDLVYAERRSL